MDTHHIITGLFVDENTTVSFIELREKYHVSDELLSQMQEHGLLAPDTLMNHNTLHRILAVQRLQHDLGINVPGAVLVLELCDELTELRDELRILKRHLDEFKEIP